MFTQVWPTASPLWLQPARPAAERARSAEQTSGSNEKLQDGWDPPSPKSPNWVFGAFNEIKKRWNVATCATIKKGRFQAVRKQAEMRNGGGDGKS